MGGKIETNFLDLTAPDMPRRNVRFHHAPHHFQQTGRTSVRDVVNNEWSEDNCNKSNNHIVIGKENHFLSADGMSMPARKDQPPPDLRDFQAKQ